MFNKKQYIENVLADAFTYEAENPVREWCDGCGESIPDWDLPVGYQQPPHMPRSDLCIKCWAEAAAEIWDGEETDQRGAEESVGPL